MFQPNSFGPLGTGNFKVSVKHTVCGDYQTTGRKTGAVTEN